MPIRSPIDTSIFMIPVIFSADIFGAMYIGRWQYEKYQQKKLLEAGGSSSKYKNNENADKELDGSEDGSVEREAEVETKAEEKSEKVKEKGDESGSDSEEGSDGDDPFS